MIYYIQNKLFISYIFQATSRYRVKLSLLYIKYQENNNNKSRDKISKSWYTFTLIFYFAPNENLLEVDTFETTRNDGLQ